MAAMFTIVIIHRHEIGRRSSRLLGSIQREVLMISSEIQKLLDRAKQNSSLVNSVDLGLRALQGQVADLQTKVAAIPVNQSLSQEDKDALAEATSNLDTSIAMLQKDIPANTQGDPMAKSLPAAATLAGAGGFPNNPPQGSGQQSTDMEQGIGGAGQPVANPTAPAPDLSNDSQHAQDADAASQAKPIAGTGQVGPA